MDLTTAGLKAIVYDSGIPDGYPARGTDNSKLLEYTGWSPPTELPEGIRETVNWYLEWKDKL
jgi:nucleoside-diphosphate-sugar epimerase